MHYCQADNYVLRLQTMSLGINPYQSCKKLAVIEFSFIMIGIYKVYILIICLTEISGLKIIMLRYSVMDRITRELNMGSTPYLIYQMEFRLIHAKPQNPSTHQFIS